MNYKIGDKVRIKSISDIDKLYDACIGLKKEGMI